MIPLVQKAFACLLAYMLALTSVCNAAPLERLQLQAGTHPAQYFMSPSGSDRTGDGTEAHPWLTPNHAGLVCGDTVTAAAGTYPSFTLTTTPSCSSHNAVLVACATFDGCKVDYSVTEGGILVHASYWTVFGWEVSTAGYSSPYAACFQATPAGQDVIHDVAFVNDVANGCQANGFAISNQVDYVHLIADIAYNAAQQTPFCYSGFSLYRLGVYDTEPGTHIYLSQLFAWNNVDPAHCQGFDQPTDGEGIIFDSLNGGDGGYPPYTQQIVLDNMIAVYNGASGVGIMGTGSSAAELYLQHITSAYNFTDRHQNTESCGQIQAVGGNGRGLGNAVVNAVLTANLAVVGPTPACGGNPAYPYMMANVNSSDLLYRNSGYGASGAVVGTRGDVRDFSAGSVNHAGTNPQLANPVQPPAPACANTASVIDCVVKMGIVANFMPTNASSIGSGDGYHLPSSTPVFDRLYPKWLCGKSYLTGLVTSGCADGE